MSFFAFVPVAQDTNAEHLFATRPFLTRAIMLAAAPLPLPTLRTMRLEIMGYLSQHLLVANEVSLDTVQGLLVLIAWSVECPNGANPSYRHVLIRHSTVAVSPFMTSQSLT
jgi:hypothetical protein